MVHFATTCTRLRTRLRGLPCPVALLAALSLAPACGDDQSASSDASSDASSHVTSTSDGATSTTAGTAAGSSETDATTTTSTSSATTTTAGTTTKTTTTAGSTTATATSTSGTSECSEIVGSMDCEALVAVSGELTLERCELCQGIACGVEPDCDIEFPCVDGVIVLQGCCADEDCEGLALYCGMFTATNNVCVLDDDV